MKMESSEYKLARCYSVKVIGDFLKKINYDYVTACQRICNTLWIVFFPPV